MPWTRCPPCRVRNARLPSPQCASITSLESSYRTPALAFQLKKPKWCFNHYSRQSPKAWEWDCPLPEGSSKPITVRYGQRKRPAVAPCFTSVFRCQERSGFETEASASDPLGEPAHGGGGRKSRARNISERGGTPLWARFRTHTVLAQDRGVRF